ncbi:MAG: STT3 domain-containing protein [Candidatus Zapsychrus exili]|nr:STT3 domain-containing protein [Candidatus Zapsychrus exili]
MLKLKNSNFAQYTLIALIALSIGLYFRLYPLLSFTSSDSSEKATVLILSRINKIAKSQINRAHPNFSEPQKQLLTKKLFNELVKKESPRLKETISRVSKEIEKDKKNNKKTYLLASDSFYYYGLTKNILNKGSISEKTKGSKYLNNLMLAPKGHWEPLNLHPYVGAFVYKIIKIFDTNISLMKALSFTPLLIVILSIIPFLFICSLLKIKPVITLTVNIFFLLSPIFIERSAFGWYDNDPYNILFPLIILSFFFLGIKKSNNTKNTIIFGSITSAAVALYAFFWQGWVLTFSIIFASTITIIIYNYLTIKTKNDTKHLSCYLGVISLTSFVFIGILFGTNEFFVLFKEGWIALKNFIEPQLSAWPDLYISVGELHSTPILSIIKTSGGKFFFYTAILGAIISIAEIIKQIFSRLKTEDYNIKISLLIFLIASFIITSGAKRFAILLLIPLSIFFAIALEKIYTALEKIITKKFPDKNKLSIKIFLSIIVLSTIIVPIKSTNKSISSLLSTIYNETWEKALLQLKEKTSENSIITAWWPPGHFIKSIAERKVSFDGATINFPQSYWISNIFLSQDERQAAGLIRMLNNSANESVEYLESLGVPLSVCIPLLKEVARLKKDDAREALKKILKNDDVVEHILKLTHSKPPESYCLIYNEFVENNLQLKFIGDWNFGAIEKINKDKNLFDNIPKRNSKEYINFLWKLAGGPHKYSGPLAQISEIKEDVLFEDGIRLNINTMNCTISSKKYGKGVPLSIFYEKDGEIIEKKFENGNLPYSITLVDSKPNKTVFLMDQELAKSILMRLFLFKGKGLKYFEPFIEESDLTGRTQIYVFKVNFDE